MNEKELAKMCNKSTSDCIELAKQLKDVQQRIDKAIESLEVYKTIFNDNFIIGYLNKLLSILRGEDK